MSQRDVAFLTGGVAVAAAVFALYWWQSSPNSTATAAPTPTVSATAPAADKAPHVPSVEESTAKLAARLAKSGGPPADWRLLGQSYDFLGRKTEAAAAYAKAGGPLP